jgi:hypothetical protein
MRAPRAAALLIALTASTAYAEDKKEPLSEAQSEKLLAFYNELVDHAARNAAEADCPALGAAIDGVVNRNLNTLQMLWAAKKANKVVPKAVQEKLDQRAGELVGALRKCWGHDAVKAAFKKMKPPDEKKKE